MKSKKEREPYRNDLENESGYFRLAAAILRQASKDYILALQSKKSAGIRRSLEKFFRSDWGQWLSGDQGEEIILTCRKIANERNVCDNSSHKK